MTTNEAARFIGVPELARQLGVSTEWVRRQCRAGRFPHYLIARQLRFSDENVLAIVAAMAVPTRPGAAPEAGEPAEIQSGRRRRYAVYPAPDLPPSGGTA